jgi:hypothetical protein
MAARFSLLNNSEYKLPVFGCVPPVMYLATMLLVLYAVYIASELRYCFLRKGLREKEKKLFMCVSESPTTIITLIEEILEEHL